MQALAQWAVKSVDGCESRTQRNDTMGMKPFVVGIYLGEPSETVGFLNGARNGFRNHPSISKPGSLGEGVPP